MVGSHKRRTGYWMGDSKGDLGRLYEKFGENRTLRGMVVESRQKRLSFTYKVGRVQFLQNVFHFHCQ